LRTAAWLACCALCVIVAGGCHAEDGPEVVLYVSVDEHLARQVLRDFEDETGIRVRMVGDTEAKKTTGLVERLRAERDAPQADVFWSSEVFQTIDLAEEGVLDPFTPASLADWPAAYRDADGRWYGFAARARVIVYAPDRVPPEQRPAAWTDLLRSTYKGRIVMADPRFGTTGGHLGAMKAYWDRQIPAYYEAFLMGLRDNEVRLLPSGNAGVVRAVATGEADLGLTDTDDVWAAQAQGMSVELVYPDHSREEEPGNGTLLIPNSVARVRGGPNPDHAAQLIEFLLSETTERMIAESTSGNLPLRPGLAADYPQHAVPDPLRVDLRAAARQRRDAVASAMTMLGGDAR
jgi:iron(III) transport system substrate-binding protein